MEAYIPGPHSPPPSLSLSVCIGHLLPMYAFHVVSLARNRRESEYRTRLNVTVLSQPPHDL